MTAEDTKAQAGEVPHLRWYCLLVEGFYSDQLGGGGMDDPRALCRGAVRGLDLRPVPGKPPTEQCGRLKTAILDKCREQLVFRSAPPSFCLCSQRAHRGAQGH